MSDLPPSQPPEPTQSLTTRPPPAGGRLDGVLGGVDRVARLQTIAAVVLGLALIAIPLYLWRRPRSESPPVTSAITPTAFADAGAGDAATSAPLAPTVSLSDPKVMECHDTGSRRTRPADCDHLAALEKGFATAITSAGSCVPGATTGGTLVYVVDASFMRKRHPLELLVPKDGRSGDLKAKKDAVAACTAAVKKGLEGVALDGVPHAHARYKVAITATYAAAPSSP